MCIRVCSGIGGHASSGLPMPGTARMDNALPTHHVIFRVESLSERKEGPSSRSVGCKESTPHRLRSSCQCNSVTVGWGEGEGPRVARPEGVWTFDAWTCRFSRFVPLSAGIRLAVFAPHNIVHRIGHGIWAPHRKKTIIASNASWRVVGRCRVPPAAARLRGRRHISRQRLQSCDRDSAHTRPLDSVRYN